MNILIPILCSEFNFNFLNFLTSADCVILFLPIDKSSALRGFAFTAQEVSRCQDLIAEIKSNLTQRKISCLDLVDWCTDPARKIDALAQLKQCKKIILVNQTTAYFREIFEKLKTSSNYAVELI